MIKLGLIGVGMKLDEVRSYKDQLESSRELSEQGRNKGGIMQFLWTIYI